MKLIQLKLHPELHKKLQEIMESQIRPRVLDESSQEFREEYIGLMINMIVRESLAKALK